MFTTFTFYLLEGAGLLDDAAETEARDEEARRERRLKVDEYAATDVEIESEGAPLQHFESDGLRDVAVGPPAAVAAFVARRVQRADTHPGIHAPSDTIASLDDLTRVAPRLADAHLLRHLAALQSRDAFAAEDHLRRHFDYVDEAASNGGVSDGSPRIAPAASEGAAEVAATAVGRGRLQRSLLALGTMHARLRHSTESLKALNEAVRIAQQSGDETALGHALAAFCALCATTSTPLASLEGSPAEDRAWGEERTSGVSTPGGLSEAEAAEDVRLLLRRCARQARALRLPHLVAFAELATARHVAARPPPSVPPDSASADGDAATCPPRGRGGSAGDASSLAARVAASSTAVVSSAARSVDALRHAVTLGAAAPATAASAASSARNPSATNHGRAETASSLDLYPPPRGLDLGAVTLARAHEAAMEQLSGGASVLEAATWDAHGVPAMSRTTALKHVRCDATCQSIGGPRGGRGHGAATAAATDTAAALAVLIRHASAHHGPAAAAEACRIARGRFPGHPEDAEDGRDCIEAAAAAAEHLAAVTRGDAKAAAEAARALAALAPCDPSIDAEAHVEAGRAFAEASLAAGNVEEAARVAAARCVDARAAGLTHASLRATLTLTETMTSAGATAAALPHALALEHAAATLRLDATRAAAVVVLAETWLDCSADGAACPAWLERPDGSTTPRVRHVADGYAAMARDALAAHMPALLSRGGLNLRARAQLAAVRSVIRTPSDFFRLPSRRLLPLPPRLTERRARRRSLLSLSLPVASSPSRPSSPDRKRPAAPSSLSLSSPVASSRRREPLSRRRRRRRRSRGIPTRCWPRWRPPPSAARRPGRGRWRRTRTTSGRSRWTRWGGRGRGTRRRGRSGGVSLRRRKEGATGRRTARGDRCRWRRAER